MKLSYGQKNENVRGLHHPVIKEESLTKWEKLIEFLHTNKKKSIISYFVFCLNSLLAQLKRKSAVNPTDIKTLFWYYEAKVPREQISLLEVAQSTAKKGPVMETYIDYIFKFKEPGETNE